MEVPGIVFAILTPLLWALSDLALKFCLKRESWWKIMVISQFFGGILMVGIALIAGESLGIPPEWAGWIAAISIIALIATAAYYKAMEKREMSIASPVCNSWAIITILLGVLFLGETICLPQWAAIALVVAGVFAISLGKGAKMKPDSSTIYAVVSMVFWGIFFFMLKLPGEIMGAAFIIAVSKLLTGSVSLPLAAKRGIRFMDTGRASLLLIASMVVFDVGGFLAYLFAISSVPLHIAAPIASAVPVFGVVLGVVILRERPGIMQALGIALAIAGTILLSIV